MASLESNLKQELTNRHKALLLKLDDDINAMKNLQASEGLFKSGGTLKKARDLCKGLLNELAKDLINALESASDTGDFRKLTAAQMTDVYRKTVESDAPFARDRLTELTDIIGQPRLLDRLHAEVIQHQYDVVSDLKVRVDRMLISAGPHRSSALVGLELILLVATAFLAGLWWADPTGNYEPLIVLGATILAVLEIIRRVRS